jgi:acetyl esterase/lipase
LVGVAATAFAATDLPLGTPVGRPVQEQGAIALAGQTANAAPEAWESVAGGLPPGSQPSTVAKFDGPERWVRNVSRPTLTAFLPEPSRATGAAMIVAPGGGFMQLAIDREGYSVAQWLNQRGIAAFVLKYRLKPMPADPQVFFTSFVQVLQDIQQRVNQAASTNGVAGELFPDELKPAMRAAQEDGLEAVRYVRTHAAQWGLAPNRIGMIGFSAGAVTTINVALNANTASRPDLVAPIYGLLPNGAKVPPTVPPAFVAVAADDTIASAASVAVYTAWRSARVSAELHVFEQGGHGFGVLPQGKSSDQWLAAFDHWLTAHGFETRR